MTWADSVPEASRCAGEPLNINGATWGGLGRGTRGECQDACLVEPLCNFLVFRASDGECSAFQSCMDTVPADGEVDVYRKLQEVDRDEERASVALRMDGVIFAALSEEQRGFLQERLAAALCEHLGVEPSIIKNSAGIAGRVGLADAGNSSVALAFFMDAVAEMGMNQISSALGTSEASERVASVVQSMPQSTGAVLVSVPVGLSHIAVRISRDQAAVPALPSSLLEFTSRQLPDTNSRTDTQQLLASAQSAAGDLTACRATYPSGTSTASVSLAETHKVTPLPSLIEPSLLAKGGQTACDATVAVRVTLGGAAVMLNPRRTLMDGDVSALPCESVNSGFRGVVWLDCLSGSLVPDTSRCQALQADVPGACEAQLRSLESAYATAYVELTRLVSQYEELSASTACEGAAEAAWRERHTALQLRADQLSASLSLHVTSIASLRPNLDGAITAEERLRSNVVLITEECQALPNTTSDLGRVRDAIEALSRCPGLGRPRFTIPRTAGNLIEGNFDIANVGDEALDQQMDALCRGAFPAAGIVRAAETGEIEQQTIEGMPTTNTASVPLIGSCPGCAGTADMPGYAQHASGHARICWNPSAELSLAGRRTDCTVGRKAVLCVVEDSPDRE